MVMDEKARQACGLVVILDLSRTLTTFLFPVLSMRTVSVILEFRMCAMSKCNEQQELLLSNKSYNIPLITSSVQAV